MITITSIKWFSGEMHGLTRVFDGQKQFNFERESGWHGDWKDVMITEDEGEIQKEQEMLHRKMMGQSLSEDAFSGAACETSDEQWEEDRISCIAEESF